MALFGGMGEFTDAMLDVHRDLVRYGGGDGAVRIGPMRMPEDELAADDLAFYERAEIPTVVVPLRSRDDFFDESNAEALVGASLIFMHGGFADWVVETVSDTPVWSAMQREVRRGASFAATSGGIMALGAVVPSFNDDFSECAWVPGLQVLPGAAIASHWDSPRFRPQTYLTLPDEQTIIGVDESTVMVGDGSSWRVMGEGSVYVRRNGLEERWGSSHRFQLDLRP